MRMLIPILAITWSTLCGAQAGDGDRAQKELAALRGKWNVVEGTAERSNVRTQFQFLEDRLWIDIGGNVAHLNFKVDPAKTPKQIDIIQSAADGSDRIAMAGIYKLNGDKLEICFTNPGKNRPTEFRRDPAPGPTLYRFERER